MTLSVYDDDTNINTNTIRFPRAHVYSLTRNLGTGKRLSAF